METHETHSPTETLAFGRGFARHLGVGDCVAMVGSLGAGKTVLVRGIAEGLGLDEMLEEGVALIEWADRAATALPRNRWEIAIEITAESSRRFTVTHLE